MGRSMVSQSRRYDSEGTILIMHFRNGEDLSIWSKDDKELPTLSSTETDGVPVRDRSNISIATSTTLTGSSEVTYTPATIASGSGVTADLITNGARAVGAVCRPFPVATVGEIRRADFDLASSTFKLSISVRPDDPSSSTTEIYVPFVHYAKALELDSSSAPYSDNGSPAKADVPSSSSSLSLDIDVRLTHGSFKVKGQYLTWTYPLPTAETTYTIEIKRRGGAISRPEAYGTTGSWSDVCGGCTIA